MTQFRHAEYKGVRFYVPAEDTDTHTSADAVGMQHWLNDSLRSTLTYAEQVWYVNRTIPDDALAVLEVFCGFGLSTAPFSDERLIEHVALDHDPGCCAAFKHLRPQASVFQGDSYALTPLILELKQFDYVLLEFNAMTTYRAMRDPKERRLLDAVFHAQPRYVAFVDSAKVKEHLHRRTYSNFFNHNIQCYESYVRGVAAFFRANYGYSMRACAHDAINYTFLFDRVLRHDWCDIFDTRPIVRLDQFKDLGYVDV
jgi:hypothetical protein